MTLPQAFRSARLTDATLARDIDNEIGNLERAYADIFGATIDESILNRLFTVVAAGLQALHLQDAAAAPVAQGDLQRWNTRLLFQSGAPFGLMDCGIPTGTVIMWAVPAIPEGWLLCNGQAVDRVQYAQLFGFIVTQFGAGDGSTTFNVPDLRGRVVIGRDPAVPHLATMGQQLGAPEVQLTVAQLPGHVHNVTLTNGTHPHGIDYHIGGTDTGSGPAIIAGQRDGVDRTLLSGAAAVGVSESPVGSFAPVSLLQPSLVLNFLIKT